MSRWRMMLRRCFPSSGAVADEAVVVARSVLVVLCEW